MISSRLGEVLLTWSGKSAKIAPNGRNVICCAGIVHESVGGWVQSEQRASERLGSSTSSAASSSTANPTEYGYADISRGSYFDDNNYDPCKEDVPVFNSDEYWLESLNCIITDHPLKPGIGVTHQASEILPFVYLGSSRTVQNPKVLARANITRVLICESEDFRCPNERLLLTDSADSLSIKRLRCGVDTSLLEKHYQEAEHFLDEAIARKERVIVVCEDGINRAPALVIAYLMMRKRLTLLDAVHYTKLHRLEGPVLWNHQLQLELVSLARKNMLLV